MALGTGVHNLSLVVRAHNRASRALAGVGRDLTVLDKVRKRVGKGFRQLGSIGAVAVKTLGIAVAGAVGVSVFAFSKFDDALTTSLAIVEDVSPKIRQGLSDTAREVAKTTIFSAGQAAEAYFHLFSAGQDVESAMRNLPVVAQFAQAGLFDLAVSTELLVTSQNALGLAFEDPIKNAEQMTRVADVLAAADERAVGSIEEFAEALTNRAAAAMRTYNIEVEEGVAVLAAWATQGLKGRTAGQAFAIVTRDLQKAALNEADAWRKVNAAVFDSQGNMRNMADIVGDLEKAMEDLTDAEKKQLLVDLGFQERSQQRILQLLGTSEAIRQFEEDFKNAGGTVERVAEKQLRSAWKQLGLLKDAIVDVFIGMGELTNEGFIDLIKELRMFVDLHAPDWIEAAGRIVDKTADWIGKFQLLLTHFKLVARGQDKLNQFFLNEFGPVMQEVIKFIDNVIRAWQDVHPVVKEALGEWAKLMPVIFLIAGAVKILGAVFALVASPALMVAAIIAGLVILFKHLWQNSEEFREVIQRVIEFFKTDVIPILSEAWEGIQAAWDEFLVWVEEDAVPFLLEAWEKIEEAIDTFLVWFETDALPWLQETWGQIQDTFSAGWEFVKQLWETATTIIMDIWEAWGQNIVAQLVIAWDFIKEGVLGGFQVLEGFFQLFTGLLSGDWDKMWEGIKNIGQGWWKIIKGGVIGIFRTIWNVLAGIWEGMQRSWEKFWSGFKDVVRGPLNFVIGLIEGFVNKFIRGLNDLIGAANSIPGVSLSQVSQISIPRLAVGGDVIRQGLAIVGESGPELLSLGKGAQVAPLGSVGGRGLNNEGIGAGVHIEQVVFQGTPQSMLDDWNTYTRLALRGL